MEQQSCLNLQPVVYLSKMKELLAKIKHNLTRSDRHLRIWWASTAVPFQVLQSMQLQLQQPPAFEGAANVGPSW